MTKLAAASVLAAFMLTGLVLLSPDAHAGRCSPGSGGGSGWHGGGWHGGNGGNYWGDLVKWLKGKHGRQDRHQRRRL